MSFAPFVVGIASVGDTQCGEIKSLSTNFVIPEKN